MIPDADRKLIDRAARLIAAADALIVTAGAGMTIGAVQEALAPHNQWLPLRPPYTLMQRTMGGVTALGACGPERTAYGAPRKLLLGLKFIDGRGRLINAGGPSKGQLLRPGDRKPPRSVGFIQCVGSRIPERPYCNKVCCAHSVENAIKLKVMNPQRDVYILYRDMMTYGFREDYYLEASNRKIIFIRYEAEDKPRVEAVIESGQPVLRVTVTLQMSISTDCRRFKSSLRPTNALCLTNGEG